MKKIYFIIIIITILTGSLLFYWYELRPAKIRIQCTEEINNKGIVQKVEYNKEPLKKVYDYNECLQRNGLKE